MTVYSIDYKIRNKDRAYEKSIEAKNLASAKKKIGKKHGYKDGRMVQIIRYSIIGYC